jgi:N utilization substance protein A
VAVAANSENVDPIGSCVGQRGSRIQTIINEVGGEKIDIIEYSDDPNKFIANALAPAKIEQVNLNYENKQAVVIVDPEQLSLAIGRDGQNVRLAARLTGWHLDIISAADKNNETSIQEVSKKEKTKKTKTAPEKKVKKQTSKTTAKKTIKKTSAPASKTKKITTKK